MSRAEAIFYILVVYKLALVAIGLWATRRTRDTDDFFLGGRRLGGWVAAISASASSSSAWTLVAVGFLGTVVFYWLPNTPGDWLERLVPFFASLGICMTAARRGRPA